ncbi:LuxR C-terminal-related transcriptional regulator [Cohnella cellulosilytica]|uniref:LuxR C-terminal-related transcriptional regulator n=1 Tax=Cohnella cellulosilytica TaxID=986710 RepID=A0ABW2FJ43_9BACL
MLTDKLRIPELPEGMVTRLRLIERIEQGASGSIAYLCAPAGYGKTVLLADWARRARTEPAWLTVGPEDNEPTSFWQAVFRAVDKVVPGFAQRADDIARLNSDTAAGLLAQALERLDRQLTVVLDDFHHIVDERLLASFAYLIEYLPAFVHIVAAGRGEPAFPTSRLVGGQRLTMLGAADLRFTRQEGGEFYNDALGLGLSEEEAGERVRLTEGWIAAMRLTLTAMDGGRTQFADMPPQLEQYLLKEAFMPLSEPMRRFLTDCSVLEPLNASLCQAVAGDERSRERLEELSRKQLFTFPLDERQDEYRLHRLFAEFLQRRLKSAEPERIPRLLEQAALWGEREGREREALEYYVACGHYEKGIRLLEAMTAKRLRVSPVWLGALLLRIPEHLLMKRPILYFSCVHMHMVDARYEQAERMMTNAERHYGECEGEWTEEDKSDFWGALYYFKMIHTSIELGNMDEAMRYMQLSAQYWPNGIRLIFAQSGIAGLPSIVRKYIRPNKFVEKATNLAILKYMSQTLGEVGCSMRTCLAEALYGYNELDEAWRTAESALNTAVRSDPNAIPEILLAARLVLSGVQRAKGRHSEAEETLRETRKDLAQLELANGLLHCDAELALMALEKDDREPAEIWLKRYRLRGDQSFTARQLYEYHCLARIYAGLGRQEEAFRLLERLTEVADEANLLYLSLEIAVTKLLLLHETGRTEEALALLRTVLLVSEPRSYARLFFDGREPMAELLALSIRSWDRPTIGSYPALSYMRSLLAGFGRRTAEEWPASDLVLILTRKELQILRLIASRKSNKEIAAELGIGYGTVRTHLHQIYVKLGIGSRSEAIRIGEQLEE